MGDKDPIPTFSYTPLAPEIAPDYPEIQKDKLLSRPPYSYASLVAQALHHKERASLQEIYSWIAQTYPHYPLDNPWWQPSIRHNLSLHKCFQKIDKSDPGQSGATWFFDPTVTTYFYDRGVLVKRRGAEDPEMLTSEEAAQHASHHLGHKGMMHLLGEEVADNEAEATEGAIDGEEEEVPARETEGWRGKRKSYQGRVVAAEESPGKRAHLETSHSEPSGVGLTLASVPGGGSSSYKEMNLDDLGNDVDIDKDLRASFPGRPHESEPAPTQHQQQQQLPTSDLEQDPPNPPQRLHQAPSAAALQEAAAILQEAGAPLVSGKYEGKFSIAKVLAFAISHSKEKKLSLNSIYIWFAENYPVYVADNEQSWKGSLRHNLSYHPIFKKILRGEGDGPGKGSFWGLEENPESSDSPSRARRPRYMKELARSKSEAEDSLDLSGSLDMTLEGEAGATPKKTQTASQDLDFASLSTAGEASQSSVRREGDHSDNLLELDDTISRPSIPGLPGFSVIDFKQSAPSVATVLIPKEEMLPYHLDPDVKPPFSLTTIVGQAIVSQKNGRALLSEIISWTMNMYPHYREKVTPWENSVRSLLASKPFFVKVPRPEGAPGKSHHWVIAPEYVGSFGKDEIFLPGKWVLRTKKGSSKEEGEDDTRLPADEPAQTLMQPSTLEVLMQQSEAHQQQLLQQQEERQQQPQPPQQTQETQLPADALQHKSSGLAAAVPTKPPVRKPRAKKAATPRKPIEPSPSKQITITRSGRKAFAAQTVPNESGDPDDNSTEDFISDDDDEDFDDDKDGDYK